jgi:hypothetical protein
VRLGFSLGFLSGSTLGISLQFGHSDGFVDLGHSREFLLSTLVASQLDKKTRTIQPKVLVSSMKKLGTLLRAKRTARF